MSKQNMQNISLSSLSEVNKLISLFSNNFDKEFSKLNNINLNEYYNIINTLNKKQSSESVSTNLNQYSNTIDKQDIQAKIKYLSLIISSILKETSRIKDALSFQLSKIKERIRQLDNKFVFEINDLSLNLKAYCKSNLTLYKKISSNIQINLKNISDKQYENNLMNLIELDNLNKKYEINLLDYYEKCKKIFTDLKEIHHPSQIEGNKDNSNKKNIFINNNYKLGSPDHPNDRVNTSPKIKIKKPLNKSKYSVSYNKIDVSKNANKSCDKNKSTNSSSSMNKGHSINTNYHKSLYNNTAEKNRLNKSAFLNNSKSPININNNYNRSNSKSCYIYPSMNLKNNSKCMSKHLCSNSKGNDLLSSSELKNNSLKINLEDSISNSSNKDLNINIYTICELVQSFFVDMKKLQESIIANQKKPKKDIKEMKIKFEKKKIKITKLCSQVLNGQSNTNNNNSNNVQNNGNSNNNLININLNNINNNEKEKYESEINELKNKIQSDKKTIIDLSKENDNLKQETELLIAQLNEMKSKTKNLNTYKQENEFIKSQNDDLCKKIESLYTKILPLLKKTDKNDKNQSIQINNEEGNYYKIACNFFNVLLEKIENFTACNEQNTIKSFSHTTNLSFLYNEICEIVKSLQEIDTLIASKDPSNSKEIKVFYDTDNNSQMINLLDSSNRTSSKLSHTLTNSNMNSTTNNDNNYYIMIINQIEGIKKILKRIKNLTSKQDKENIENINNDNNNDNEEQALELRGENLTFES